MRVLFYPEAEAELKALPPRERGAMLTAIGKLEVLGDRLPAPHSSAVKGVSSTLRELRPRAGRSAWCAFYRRIGSSNVIGAIAPEATVDPAGFRRAVERAVNRLGAVERTEQTNE